MIYIIIVQGRKDEADIQKMIHRVMEFNCSVSEDRRITISMEFEKPREALIPLMSLPDVVSEFIMQYSAKLCLQIRLIKYHSPIFCSAKFMQLNGYNWSIDENSIVKVLISPF